MGTIFKKAQLKNPKSMRYEAEWLLECLLLRCKSMSVYEHIRATGLIPLSHRDTLRRLLSGVSCKLGFNEAMLEAIERDLRGRPTAERVVVLSFDEMSILQSLDLNMETLTIDGYVCVEDDPVINRESFAEIADICGEEGIQLCSEDVEIRKDIKEKDLADHALVFMCRPLLGRWVCPFGVFASRSAAPGKDLHRLMMAAIIKLQACGAIVLAVTCDGAQTNKTVWKLSGIGAEYREAEDDIKNSITNPIY